MAGDNAPCNGKRFRGITWSSISTSLEDKIQSFWRWMKDHGKTVFPPPKQPFLLGVYFVIMFTAAAVAVLTKLIHYRLQHDERWDRWEDYGAYPQPDVVEKLVLAGYTVTGVGLGVGALGLITTFWRPKWLLAIGMVLCAFALVLSLGMVAYGTSANILENIAKDRRVEYVYDNLRDFGGYYKQKYYSDNTYYENRDHLKWDYSKYIIYYYQEVVQAWKTTTETNIIHGEYAPVQNGSCYYSASQRFLRYLDQQSDLEFYYHNSSFKFPSSEEFLRYGSSADYLLPHLQNLLDIFRLLADAHSRLIQEDIGLVSTILKDCSESVKECYRKNSLSPWNLWRMSHCQTTQDNFRIEHMIHLYKSLIAMTTFQAVFIFVVAINFDKARVKENRKRVLRE